MSKHMKRVEKVQRSTPDHGFAVVTMNVRTFAKKSEVRITTHEVLLQMKCAAHDKKHVKRERKYPHAYRFEVGL